MKILKLESENKEIKILTEEEILSKCQSRISELNELMEGRKTTGEWDGMVECYDKSQKCKMPYTLFRMNQLYQYLMTNVGCEITETQFYDRIGIMPPVKFKRDIYNGYVIPECIINNIFEHVFYFKGKFYCVLMDWKK